MIPKEILKKVRRIEITTRGLVNDVFSGEYHSVFKGRGMDFAEVREYSIGDDVRSIDWNVTARMGHPFIKLFQEERELTVLLMVDASSSGDFGTRGAMKGEIAAEICALLAFSAIKNNDKVGLIIFTDRVEKYVSPKKGRGHVLRVIREILYHRPESRRTDISGALEFLSRVSRRRSVVFVVSDFLASGYEKALGIAGRRHDVVAVTVTDPREMEIPSVGFIELEDAETGEVFLLDSRSLRFREAFQRRAESLRKTRDRTFRSKNIDSIDIFTHRPYIKPLLRFFRMRARRRR
jgi:uncharacterized protein (DUF58 family)